MPLENGFITIHRSILSWEWYDDINTKTLFIHLLLTVNYEDRKWRNLTVRRGQRVASLAILSKETHLSEQCIRTSLKRLKSTGNLTSKTTNKYTLYTVLNYDMYQASNRQPNKQANKQLTSNQQATNNNETKITKITSKTINKKTLEQMFDSFWTAYPKKRSKEQAKKAWGKLMPSSDLFATMLRAIAAQKKSHEWTKEDGAFIPHPATWLNNHRWEDELETHTKKETSGKEKMTRSKYRNDQDSDIFDVFEVN